MPNHDGPVNVRCIRKAGRQQPAIPKEISWLSFNERVLQEADNVRNPLLERVKFLGIFSNNLDEFYRVRFAQLLRTERERGPKCDVMGTRVSRVIKDIKQRVLRQAELFNDIASRLFRELEEEGILIVDEHRLNDEQARFVREYFQNEVRPRLVPLMCDQSHEVPALRDQFIYLAVELSVKGRTSRVYAFIEVPTDSLPRFVILPKRGNDDCVILLEDVIRYCLDETFALLNPEQYRAWTVKITRDAALDIEGDSGDSYMDRVHRGLRKRRTGAPVRMVYDKGLPQPFLKFLVNKMKLERDNNLIPGQRYHNFKDFMQFPKLGRDHLVWKPAMPIIHPALQGRRSVLAAIAERDILLHHPYHGFSSFVELLREAAIDPRVTAIAMTVYRVSPTSSVLNALSNAVRNGKQVTVVIELLARFDEENNLEWVDRLREEGVEVITGVRGLKVHAKLCLISRREGKHQVRFATIGTGNFHEGTARVYTDHILMTRDPNITQEVMRLFEFFRSNYKVAEFRHLIVSPFKPRGRWRDLIRREINNARHGKPAYVWVKLNNLADAKLTKEFYVAANEGVEVRLIVRSMNSLVPGIAGVSEGIEAISIVGRYLEHSRFLVFCNDGRPEVYITSGDWLSRNFDDRIEVACPIRDPELATQLVEYFQIQWADTDNARIWDSALSNQHRPPAQELSARNSHERIRAYLSVKANPTAVGDPTPTVAALVLAPQTNGTRIHRPMTKQSLVIQC
jgi:polyphosphate kinase